MTIFQSNPIAIDKKHDNIYRFCIVSLMKEFDLSIVNRFNRPSLFCMIAENDLTVLKLNIEIQFGKITLPKATFNSLAYTSK